MYYFTLLEPLEVKEYSVSKTASIQVIEKSFLQPQLFCLKTSSWWFRRHKCLTIFGQYLIIQAIVIVLRGKNIIPRDRKIAECGTRFFYSLFFLILCGQDEMFLDKKIFKMIKKNFWFWGYRFFETFDSKK